VLDDVAPSNGGAAHNFIPTEICFDVDRIYLVSAAEETRLEGCKKLNTI